MRVGGVDPRVTDVALGVVAMAGLAGLTSAHSFESATVVLSDEPA